MDVVGQDFQFVDKPAIDLGTLDEEVFQASDHVLSEYTAAVLRAKYDVITTFVEGMSTPPEERLVRLGHTFMVAQWELLKHGLRPSLRSGLRAADSPA